MPQEFPIGNYSNSQPIDDELDDIYRDIENSQTDRERLINLDWLKLHKIAESLDQARKYKLDTKFFYDSTREVWAIGTIAKILFNKDVTRKSLESLTEEQLKVVESEHGAKIFGEIMPNEQREFVYDGQNDQGHISFFFHQVITDQGAVERAVTLHYEARQEGTLRVSSDPKIPNEFISGKERDDFMTATEMYHDIIMSQVYKQDIKASDLIKEKSNISEIGRGTLHQIHNDDYSAGKKAA